jgi:hypothetical protein
VVEGGRAVAVQARRGEESVRVEGGEIVLCAGAVGSPHLLMLSGIGPAEQLRAAGVPGCTMRRGRAEPARSSARTARGSRGAAGAWTGPRCGSGAALHGAGFHAAQRHADPMVSFATNRGSRRRRAPRWASPQPVLNLSAGHGELRCSRPSSVQPLLDFNFLSDELIGSVYATRCG